MAQFYTDFSQYSTSQRLSDTDDWTLVRGSDRTTIVDDASSPGGQSLDVVVPDFQGTFNELIKHDDLTGSDVQMWVKVSGLDEGAGRFGLAVRDTEGSSREETAGYQFSNDHDFTGHDLRIRVVEENEDSSNQIGYEGDALDDGIEDIEFRLESSGDQHSVKVWDTNNSEPEWDLQVTDDTVTDSGALGLALMGEGDYTIDAIGIGTDGDPAPTEPVDDDVLLSSISIDTDKSDVTLNIVGQPPPPPSDLELTYDN